MGARSKRLAGPLGVAAAGSYQLIYTCPEGKTALVKSIRAYNAAGADRILGLTVGGAGTENRFVRTTIAPGATYIDPDSDPVVVHSGEQLHARQWTSGAVANDIVLTISGAELEA